MLCNVVPQYLCTKEAVVQALRDETFGYSVQDIRDLRDEKREGRWVEWLIRPEVEGVAVEAGRFVTSVNEAGLARMLDGKVISAALNWMKKANDVYRCSINVSAESVSYFGFTHAVSKEIERSGVDPRRLCFEITEFQPISNLEAATLFAKTMRELGSSMALDDFGRGVMHMDLCAPFNYVDYIKIDRACTGPATKSHAHRKLLHGLVHFGRSVGAEIVAEGVETARHLTMVEDLGIEYYQGYFHGKPVRVQGIESSEECLYEQYYTAS